MANGRENRIGIPLQRTEIPNVNRNNGWTATPVQMTGNQWA